MSHNADMDQDGTSVAARLKELRLRSGLGLREVAGLIGRSPSSYADYERTYKKRFQPMDLLQALRPHLVGRGNPPITEAEVMALGMPGKPQSDPDADFFEPNVLPAPGVTFPQPRRIHETAKVPVMGTAEAGDEGFFEINLAEGPVEYIDRPAALIDVAQGELFAIRVHGESMEPVWEAGDEVFIVKSWPLKHRGYVVATVERGKGEHPRALLKQYISRDNNRVHLRQFNPAKEVELPRRMVKDMWRALHWREIKNQ